MNVAAVHGLLRQMQEEAEQMAEDFSSRTGEVTPIELNNTIASISSRQAAICIIIRSALEEEVK